MLSWRPTVFLLSVYLLVFLPGDTSGRTPKTVAEKCNGGTPIDASHVSLELFYTSSRNGVPKVRQLSCSSRRRLVGPTKVVMHGFGSSGESTKEYGWVQARKPDENLIIVDWSILAQKRNVLKKRTFYRTAASCALEVGKYLAKCLNDLNVDPSSLHLFGHSLGAHGVGMAGRELGNLGRHIKPSRVTGMDPAGPGFIRNSLGDRRVNELFRTDVTEELKMMKIGRDSGDFVDIVHTNIGAYGAKPQLGHVDYYVNGGGPEQPKCRYLAKLDSAPSHSYANKVVVASLQNKRQQFWECQTSQTNICDKAINGVVTKMFDVAKTRKDINDGKYFLYTPKTEC